MANQSPVERRLSIRDLLIATSLIALMLIALTSNAFPMFLRVLAIAAGLFWTARCIFAFSLSLRSPFQEITFLAALPMYVLSIVLSIFGFVVIVAKVAGVFYSLVGG